jgi:hypothetical protein
MSVDTEDVFRDILHPLMDWATKEEKTSEEEKNKIIEIFNSLKEFFSQKKIEQYKEIEFHETFMKNLNCVTHPKIEELEQKENELIGLLRKDAVLLDVAYIYVKSFEDIILSLQRKNRLQSEVNIIVEDLRREGIIKTR